MAPQGRRAKTTVNGAKSNWGDGFRAGEGFSKTGFGQTSEFFLYSFKSHSFSKQYQWPLRNIPKISQSECLNLHILKKCFNPRLLLACVHVRS